jgi:hypothetical protein
MVRFNVLDVYDVALKSLYCIELLTCGTNLEYDLNRNVEVG